MAKIRPKIVNCFYDETRSGIGDFLRGSIFLYDFCLNNGIDFDIDIKHHRISEFLKIESIYNYQKEDIVCLSSISESKLRNGSDFYKTMYDELFNVLELKEDITYLFCNFSDILKYKSLDIIPSLNNQKLSQGCIDWFSSKIQFSEVINNDAESFIKEKNLSNKPFHIIHLRTGDEEAFFKSTSGKNHFDKNWFPDKNDCYDLCYKIFVSLSRKPCVVLSDNNDVKKHIQSLSNKKNLPIYVPHLKSSHTQQDPSFHVTEQLKVDIDSLYYTALDAKLISLSCSVRSFSVYFWGSGFSCWFSKIFNKPFFCKPFIKRLT